MLNLLLDTGSVVALLDHDDKMHDECAAFFLNYHGNLYSTESILTESLYLLNNSFLNQKRCLEFFLTTVKLVSSTSTFLQRCMALMEKYQDIPMDFADATLVALAEEIECKDIFTLDYRGFQTYRLKRNQTFKIYPEL